jgi:HD-like signal output (HDOD) protein/CheY-like chemotaxis protein
MNQQNEFDDIRERVMRLPLPALAQKIIQLAESDTAPVQRLAEVIAADPLFAVRLLKIANFSAGPAHTLTTVPQSISILGLHQWKAMAVGLSLFGFAPTPPKESQPDEVSSTRLHLWEHAIGCAMVAGRIARKSGRVPPHLAFAAGLLHDLGRVLLLRVAPQKFIESTRMAAEKNLPITEAETLALGITHTEVGELWARKLEWVPQLRSVLGLHHQSLATLPDSVDEEARNLITVVHLADTACESKRIGKGGEPSRDWRQIWRELQLRPDEWWDDLEDIKQEILSLRGMFGFSKAETPKAQPLPRPEIETATDSLSQPQKVAVNGSRGQVIPFPARGENGTVSPERSSPKKLTILVVEDHGSLCDMLSLYFMRYGYHVRTANNGDTALQLLAKEEIHLVLLDLMLPRVDGFAVLKQLREWAQERKPYIIVVSAGASEKDRNKVLELGANEYMPKPFHLIRLLERVQAVENYLL